MPLVRKFLLGDVVADGNYGAFFQKASKKNKFSFYRVYIS